LPNVGFFVVHKKNGIDRVLNEMALLSHRNPLATVGIEKGQRPDDLPFLLGEFENKVTMRAVLQNALTADPRVGTG
jgi:hypothetical protein